MKRGFGEEYRDYIEKETPDLWERIEKRLEEEPKEDRVPMDGKEGKKFHWGWTRLLASAAACVCLVGLGAKMAPIMLNRGVKLEENGRQQVKEPKAKTPASGSDEMAAMAQASGTAEIEPEMPASGSEGIGADGPESMTAQIESEAQNPLTVQPAETDEVNEAGQQPLEGEAELDEWEDEAAYEMEAAEEIAWDEPSFLTAPVGYAASRSQAFKASTGEPYSFDDAYFSSKETYAPSGANSFSLVSVNPLSTFSADVDTASYANVRRMIEDGYLAENISPNAVRPEEFINYFSYDSLKLPGEGEKFGVTMQMAPCPWKEDHDLLMIGIRTQEIDLGQSPPENLTFLLDVSGSMADEDKLPLLQKSFRQLVEQLGDDDRVSIVTYANDVQIVLDSASGADKKAILKALDGLRAEGGTYGEGGIQKAYELAERNFNPEGNNRILLATDGDLNIGISDPDELKKLIAEERDKGIFLSVLGFGSWGIRDDVMEGLADHGNGNYSYIDSLLEAKKVLVQEMGATFHTVAEDVKFQVEFNPQNVNAYRLIGYQNRLLEDTDFADDSKDAGEIGAGHSVVVLYELIPAGSKAAVSLKYQAAGEDQTQRESAAADYGKEWATVKIRYKEPGETASLETEYVATEEDFAAEPSEDMLFASMAAEFAMILQEDENKGSSSFEGILESLKGLDLREDEYKEEFKSLVRMLYKR